MNLIWLIAYIAGYAFAWRKAFEVILNEVRYGRPDNVDIIMSCLLATFLALVFPLWLIPIALYHLLIKRNLEAWVERNYK